MKIVHLLQREELSMRYMMSTTVLMMIVMFLNIMVTPQFLYRRQAKNLTKMTQTVLLKPE